MDALFAPLPPWASWQGIVSRLGILLVVLALTVASAFWVDLSPKAVQWVRTLDGFLQLPWLPLIGQGHRSFAHVGLTAGAGLLLVAIAERGTPETARGPLWMDLASVVLMVLILAVLLRAFSIGTQSVRALGFFAFLAGFVVLRTVLPGPVRFARLVSML
jgi:hypothetical protein